MEREKERNVCSVLGVLSGLLFILDGALRGSNTSYFTYIILNYGFPDGQYAAPVIVAVEILLGGCLLFGIYRQWSAVIGIAMQVFFTAIYTYALVENGITNSGCFGTMRELNNSPTLLYIRNMVMVAMLLYVFMKDTNSGARYVWMYILLAVGVGGGSFASGQTFVFHGARGERQGEALGETPLKDFVSVSADSTFGVFVFSYGCPHCINSIANLNEYERFGVVDKVIGIAMGDSVGEAWFREQTNPRFEVRSCGNDVLKITRSFPRFYFVRGDSLLYTSSGEVPAACLFRKSMEKRGIIKSKE